MYDIWMQIVLVWLLGSIVLTVLMALALRFAVPPVLDAVGRLRYGPDPRIVALEHRCRRIERRLGAHPPQIESIVGRSS